MADTFKVLAQVNPPANTLTDTYTAPSQAVISSISVCNGDSKNSSTFRISIAVGGAADNLKQYLYDDATIKGGSTVVATLGVTLATGDIIRVYAGSNMLAFNVFGVEVV